MVHFVVVVKNYHHRCSRMLNCVTDISWSTLTRLQRRRRSPPLFPSCSQCQCLLWAAMCPVEVEKEVEVVEAEAGKFVEVLKKGGGCFANVV